MQVALENPKVARDIPYGPLLSHVHRSFSTDNPSSLIVYSGIPKYGLRFKELGFNLKASCHTVIPATKISVIKFERDYILKMYSNECAWLHCPLKKLNMRL